MLIDMIAVFVMEMAVVEIIDVIVMPDRRVPAVLAVNVRVPFVDLAFRHTWVYYHSCNG